MTDCIADALDASWLESLPSSAQSRRLSPAGFRHHLVEQARAVGACLVLSEGTDLASDAAGLITANVITLR